MSVSCLLSRQELVDELYKFRDCYFETHSVEDAGRKHSDVAEEMAQTLKKLEEKEGKGLFKFKKKKKSELICRLSFTTAPFTTSNRRL